MKVVRGGKRVESYVIIPKAYSNYLQNWLKYLAIVKLYLVL